MAAGGVAQNFKMCRFVSSGFKKIRFSKSGPPPLSRRPAGTLSVQGGPNRARDRLV